jgi:RNA polymerase sigma-70 factor (ECF subfamily)
VLPPPKPDHQPDRDVLQRELRRHLARVLQKLSAKRRIAIVLHQVHQFSVAEIAHMQDCPEYTVRDRLKKGRKLLRRFITRDPAFKAWLESWDETRK